MKLFKKRNIQALIYGLFMLLPFLSILGRVLYTQWNQEAYQSYYGETINEVEYNEVQYVNLEANNEYRCSNTIMSTTSQLTMKFIYLTDLQLYSVENSDNFVNATKMGIYSNSEGTPRIYFYQDNTAIGQPFSLNSQVVDFTFTYLGSDDLTSVSSILQNLNFYSISYNQFSYLDNAFEYSIDRFVDENNFGNFDFFQWFSTFFLQDNAVNNLYVHFINWYMNYMLYVSLGYLIFSILMWFVNFFRSLVEKSTDLNL